ncbi:MAG: NnrS family protein [Hyphomicrobiales bacterium]
MPRDWIGLVPAMAVDALFLIVFPLAISREIIAGRNWRNIKTVGLIAILAAANIGFHAEVYLTGAPDYALRAAIAAIIGLIMVVGGRIVPSFTRNWLARQGPVRLPASFDRFDVISIVASGAALALWVMVPVYFLSGIALLAAGFLQIARLSRWAGLCTCREPLVLVLHLGYAFVALGYLLVGLAVSWPDAIPATGALHAWHPQSGGLETNGPGERILALSRRVTVRRFHAKGRR